MKSIAIYIHIPFCIRKCLYCDFLSGPYGDDIQRRYVDALCKEIEFMGQQLESVAVSSVYIGGGTPSWLDGYLMEKIMKTLKANFSIEKEAEITIECNPGTVTMEKFSLYRRIGINRLSIGLQSANDDELKLLGRIHTYDKFLHTYEMARKSGFYDINVDIMTGLPGQTLDKLMDTLKRVIALKPEHISAYALIVEEGTYFYERYKDDVEKQRAGKEPLDLPNEDLEYQLYKMAQITLAKYGYLQYEISNYAKEGYACNHNITYWKRGDYLGFGIGAASLMYHHRFHNTRDIYSYMESWETVDKSQKDLPVVFSDEKRDGTFQNPTWEEVARLSKKDEMEEFMYLGLRMNEGISRADFYEAFGCSVEAIYGRSLEKLKAEEMLMLDGGRIYLTDQGRDLSNYVLAHFLLDE